MKSLRFRLIAGIALIAVVPLAVAMFVMAGYMRDTVHAQAGERLTGVMALIESQLAARVGRTQEQLSIVAADPQLERLHTLKPASGQALVAYLAEKQSLLGLVQLEVEDVTDRLGIAAEPDSSEAALLLVMRQPVAADPEIVLRGALALDLRFLQGLRQTSGVDLVLRDSRGHTWVTTLDEDVEPFVPLMEHPGDAGLGAPSHLVRSFEVNVTDEASPSITGFVSLAEVNATVHALRVTAILLALGGLALAIVLGTMWSRQVSRPVQAIASFTEQIARGEWDAPLNVQSIDEFHTLVEGLDRMRQDLRTYRERLLAGERQAAWGQMARKVAHEIRNPLTPIAVSVADLKRSHDLGRDDFPAILAQAVKTIEEEVRALNHLLSEFSSFGRLPAPVMERVDATGILEDLKTLYAHDVGRGRLRFHLAETPVWLRADRAQVQQALVNLIKNGLESLGDSGHVDVGVTAEGGTVLFSIADSGPGISAEQRAKLFTPNFTTKVDGSGLGLMIVERIVGDHSGMIQVDSSPELGTTFRIKLPENTET